MVFFNHPEKECVCGPGIVKRYLSKISGPLLDRIDLHVEVTPVSFDQLSVTKPSSENSKTIRDRVILSRKIQARRFKDLPGIYCNAQMPSRMVRQVCKLKSDGSAILKTAMAKLQLSARAYDRILKVSRTAADLDQCNDIEIPHIAEAIQYRSLDREDWMG